MAPFLKLPRVLNLLFLLNKSKIRPGSDAIKHYGFVIYDRKLRFSFIVQATGSDAIKHYGSVILRKRAGYTVNFIVSHFH